MGKRIVILGSNGMLGQAAKKYFSKNNEVILFEGRYTKNHRHTYLSALKKLEPEIIINCVGRIKQKSSDFEDLFVVNALLPVDLNSMFEDALIIHPSTDCVFSGESSQPYSVFDFPNAYDDYGLSKVYGELSGKLRSATYIIRSSIIGLTKDYGSEGLLDWFMRQEEGTSINGFTNHLWNGITTLEWCCIAEKIIHGNPPIIKNGIIQVGASEAISKYSILKSAREIFGRNISIKPIDHIDNVARVLEPSVRVEGVHQQLLRYREWLDN